MSKPQVPKGTFQGQGELIPNWKRQAQQKLCQRLHLYVSLKIGHFLLKQAVCLHSTIGLSAVNDIHN